MTNPQVADALIVEPYRILSICDDAVLCSSRDTILRRTGYDVTSVSSKEMHTTTSFTGYDLVILCNSVPSHILRFLASIVPAHSPRVLFLHLSVETTDVTQAVCDSFDTSRGPQALLHKIDDLLKNGRKPPSSIYPQRHFSATR